MKRYLLFDSDCSRCSRLAAGIARQSDGRLSVRSLRDPQMQDALTRGRPGWRREPTLLEIEGSKTYVFTGLTLRAQLLMVLGPRRAWRVAQLVARERTPLGDVDESRRALIKRGAALAAAVAGLALLGPAPARAQAEPDSVEVASASRRPGPYSRKEGIESWKVNKTPSGAVVTFQHKKRRLSGEVQITYGGGGDTSTFVLSRDRERLQFAFNAERATFAGKDAQGRATSGRFDQDRNRWDVDAESDQVFHDSEQDFRIGLAITSDLAPRPRNRADESTQQVAPASTCPCTREYRQRGEGDGSARSLACEAAVEKVHYECITQWCWGCCQLVGEDCDCGCWIADYVCHCGRSGDPCAGPCN